MTREPAQGHLEGTLSCCEIPSIYDVLARAPLQFSKHYFSQHRATETIPNKHNTQIGENDFKAPSLKEYSGLFRELL